MIHVAELACASKHWCGGDDHLSGPDIANGIERATSLLRLATKNLALAPERVYRAPTSPSEETGSSCCYSCTRSLFTFHPLSDSPVPLTLRRSRTGLFAARISLVSVASRRVAERELCFDQDPDYCRDFPWAYEETAGTCPFVCFTIPRPPLAALRESRP